MHGFDHYVTWIYIKISLNQIVGWNYGFNYNALTYIYIYKAKGDATAKLVPQESLLRGIITFQVNE